MQYQALATLAYEVGEMVGDTSTTFLSRVERYLNNRYDDALVRTGATIWSLASSASLGSSEIPMLGIGRIIREGATADAYYAKRQFQKAGVFEQKYEFALSNFVIAGNYNTLNLSTARYDDYV